MTSSLLITTNLTTTKKVQILASVVSGGTLPLDIFIYENNGTSTLGTYIGICNLEEYRRLQTFSGTIIPSFGNKFIKYTEAKILLYADDDQFLVIKNIKDTATFLSRALSSSVSSTQIITIP